MLTFKGLKFKSDNNDGDTFYQHFLPCNPSDVDNVRMLLEIVLLAHTEMCRLILLLVGQIQQNLYLVLLLQEAGVAEYLLSAGKMTTESCIDYTDLKRNHFWKVIYLILCTKP